MLRAHMSTWKDTDSDGDSSVARGLMLMAGDSDGDGGVARGLMLMAGDSR